MSISITTRLPLRDAAAHSGLSVATLRRRIHDGTLPAVKKGNRHEVAVTDLDAIAAIPVVPLHDRAVVAFAELEAAAKRVAAAAPPLTDEQRARIASLLGGV